MKIIATVEIETTGEHPQNMVNDVLSYFRIMKYEYHQLNNTVIKIVEATITNVEV